MTFAVFMRVKKYDVEDDGRQLLSFSRVKKERLEINVKFDKSAELIRAFYVCVLQSSLG